MQEDGSCDANSVPCWIQDESCRSHNELTFTQPQNRSTNASLSDYSETRNGRQLACCTGLTMDLLLELMKDLNFEVELYEVKDRLWGGWTVRCSIVPTIPTTTASTWLLTFVFPPHTEGRLEWVDSGVDGTQSRYGHDVVEDNTESLRTDRFQCALPGNRNRYNRGPERGCHFADSFPGYGVTPCLLFSHSIVTLWVASMQI